MLFYIPSATFVDLQLWLSPKSANRSSTPTCFLVWSNLNVCWIVNPRFFHFKLHLWSGWWFGTWIFFFHILEMSSSQLTNSYFFRGVGIPPTSHLWCLKRHVCWILLATSPFDLEASPTDVIGGVTSLSSTYNRQWIITLWLLNIAMENGKWPIELEIDVFWWFRYLSWWFSSSLR